MLPSVNEMKDDPPAFNKFFCGNQSQTLPVLKWAEALVPDLHHRVPALLMQKFNTGKKNFPQRYCLSIFNSNKNREKKKNITETRDVAESQHQDKQSKIFLKRVCQSCPEPEPSSILTLGYKVKSKSKDNWKSIGGWQRSNPSPWFTI